MATHCTAARTIERAPPSAPSHSLRFESVSQLSNVCRLLMLHTWRVKGKGKGGAPFGVHEARGKLEARVQERRASGEHGESG